MNPMMFGDTIRLPVFKPEFREMQEQKWAIPINKTKFINIYTFN